MSVIHSYMTEDHRKCDREFAEAEKAVADKKWDVAQKLFASFYSDMDSHFHMEEDVLFPHFEEATGMTEGPTAVMRSEHENMRKLFESMKQNLESQDRNAYLGNSETLLYLMQQHNAKEEQMLYVMADRAMSDQSAGIVEKMKEVQSVNH